MEFEKFPKIPRLRREVIITEKIDGTNAQILVNEDGSVQAGSRNKWVGRTIGDNYGFGAWVEDRATELAELLGPGRHFGEWWGQGIQRNYGLTEKRFSLFNVSRWHTDDPDYAIDRDLGVYVVPTLYTGVLEDFWVSDALLRLRALGSAAAPGFMNPEGIVLYHTAGNHLYKVTLENDEQPKTAVA